MILKRISTLLFLSCLLFLGKNLAAQTFEQFDLFNWPAPSPSSYPKYLTECDGKFFYSAYNNITGTELYVSDGTLGGTHMVKDIKPGLASSAPEELTSFKGKLYFIATNVTNGEEVWVSDGTEAGTTLLKDIRPGTNGSAPSDLTVFGDYLYFGATDGLFGYELWRTYGTTDSTYLFKDLASGSNSGYSGGEVIVFGSKMIFIGGVSSQGREPYITDGTTAGTTLLRDIKPGSSPSNPAYFTIVGDKLFFSADSTGTGTELFITDGTTTGTKMVKNINPGSGGSKPVNLISFKGKLFFRAWDGGTYGQELWCSNGADTGTMMIKDIEPGSGNSSYVNTTDLSAYNMIVMDSTLYLHALTTAYGEELWKSDGTPAGTMIMADVFPGTEDLDPNYLTLYNNKIYFRGYSLADRFQLWRTDGTAAGTEALLVSGYDAYSPLNNLTEFFFVFNNSLWFASTYFSASGLELWKFNDGSAAGTFNLNGKVVYANSGLVGMANVPVDLVDSNNVIIANNITTVSGLYSFSSVAGGQYSLQPQLNGDWLSGGINSADAMLVLKHFVGLSQLQGIYLKAADVNADNVVNSLDALMISKRFTGQMNSFPAGDWTFDETNVNIAADTSNLIIKTLKLGDVNGSYLP